MTDRRRAFALLLVAAMLIPGAVAHAYMGSRFVREIAREPQSGAGLARALGAGWQLGAVSLLAFGVIALVAGVARWRGRTVGPAPLWIAAAALASYGAGALALGDHSYFRVYLGYIIVGSLLALGVAPRREVRPD